MASLTRCPTPAAMAQARSRQVVCSATATLKIGINGAQQPQKRFWNVSEG